MGDTKTNVPRTGHQIYSSGQELNEYEYSGGFSNLFEGIFGRQLKTGLQPDPREVLKYSEYSERILEMLTDRMVAKGCPTILPPVEQWLASKPWNSVKRNKYRKNIEQVLNTNDRLDVSDTANFFTSFMKTEERYPIIGEPTEAFLTHDPKRGRIISNPVGLVFQGLGTYVQHSIHLDIKKVLGNYCHGKSFKALASNMTEALHNRQLSSICLDGSNHDGHQHISLIKSIDFVFYEKLKQKGYFSSILNIQDHKTLDRVYRVLDKCFKTEQFKVKHRINLADHRRGGRKRFIPLITQTWKGTVLSGHPTLTTLGNTLRVISYIAYYLKIPARELFLNLKEQKKPFLVSGDDVVLWTDDPIQDRQRILDLSSTNTDKKFIGLGQCYKEVTIGQKFEIDFLSKDIMYDPETQNFYVFRALPKALWGSRYYTTHDGINENQEKSIMVHRKCVCMGLQYEIPHSWAEHLGSQYPDVSEDDPQLQKTLKNYRFNAVEEGNLQVIKESVVESFYQKKYNITPQESMYIKGQWHNDLNDSIQLPPNLCHKLGIPRVTDLVLGINKNINENLMTKITKSKLSKPKRTIVVKKRNKISNRRPKAPRRKMNNQYSKLGLVPTDTMTAEDQMNLCRLHPGTFPAKFYDFSSGLSYPSTVISGSGSIVPRYAEYPYIVYKMCLTREWLGQTNVASITRGVNNTIIEMFNFDSDSETVGYTTNDLYGGDMSELTSQPRGSGIWAMHMNFSYGTVAADKGSVVYIGSAPYNVKLSISELISAATTKTTTDKTWSLIDYISKTSAYTTNTDAQELNKLLTREQTVYFVIANPQQTISSTPPKPILGYGWRGNITWMPDYTNTFTQGVANKKEPSTRTLVDINHIGGYPRSNLKPPEIPSFGVPSAAALSLIRPQAIPIPIPVQQAIQIDAPAQGVQIGYEEPEIDVGELLRRGEQMFRNPRINRWDERKMVRRDAERRANRQANYSFGNPPIRNYPIEAVRHIEERAPSGIISERFAIATSGAANSAASMVDITELNELQGADPAVISRFVNKLIDWWGLIPGLDLSDFYEQLVETKTKLDNYDPQFAIRTYRHDKKLVNLLFAWIEDNGFSLDHLTTEDEQQVYIQGTSIGLKLLTTQSQRELLNDLQQQNYEFNVGTYDMEADNNKVENGERGENNHQFKQRNTEQFTRTKEGDHQGMTVKLTTFDSESEEISQICGKSSRRK